MPEPPSNVEENNIQHKSPMERISKSISTFVSLDALPTQFWSIYYGVFFIKI